MGLHYRLLAQFKVDASTMPAKPSFIDSYNFGVTDVILETVFRNIQGNTNKIVVERYRIVLLNCSLFKIRT